MLPQLDHARMKQWPVLVMNPNCSKDPRTGKAVRLSTMPAHTSFIWKKYVQTAGFKDLLVIAHSAGGFCVEKLIKDKSNDFCSQVRHLAFTDTGSVTKKTY